MGKVPAGDVFNLLVLSNTPSKSQRYSVYNLKTKRKAEILHILDAPTVKCYVFVLGK